MRLLPCHKGHRFRLAHWSRDQHIDITWVGKTKIVATDEQSQSMVFDRNDFDLQWIHLGASPPAKRKRK